MVLAVWEQSRSIALMLRRLPTAATQGVAEECQRRLREVWARTPAEQLGLDGRVVSMIGHR